MYNGRWMNLLASNVPLQPLASTSRNKIKKERFGFQWSTEHLADVKENQLKKHWHSSTCYTPLLPP
eukprot:5081844-Prorocentrum_lima.AAC.1